MRTAALGAILASALATSAAAQGIGVSGLHGPYADQIMSEPSDAQILAAWPAAAAARQTPGNAIAACKADLAGRLSDCRLMVARPANAGFGEALLALAPRYRLRYAAEGKRPAAADVLISASWPVPDVAPSWRVEPKPGDFMTTFTDAAWRSQGPLFAVMNCLLGKLGTLYQCVVVDQDPPGKGLGEMTLRFASYLRFKPAMLRGKPIPVGLTIPFNYRAERRFAPPGAPPASY